MKSVFTSRRNKIPHNNEGKERKETPFFAKESKKPFFNVVNGGAVQTKLTVGQPGDKYEKEADHMADAVVNNTSKPEIQNKQISNIQRESLATPQEDEKLGTAEQRVEEDKLVQEKPEIRKMEAPEEEMVSKMEGEEEETVHKKEEEEEIQKKGEKEEEETVQTKTNTDTKQTASAGLSNTIKSKAGTGKKMSPQIKAEMESGFGSDFSTVNIHTDQDAIGMNKQLGAQAFTHGKDIYFNSGKYNPDTTQGKHLLAHELTHVVQQNNKLQKQGEEYGQSSTGVTRHLISDLSTPITIGSQPRYELIQHGAELMAMDTEVTYRWRVIDTRSGATVYEEITEQPQTRIQAEVSGNYRVNVTVLGNGSPMATSISMNQEVVAEDSYLSTSLNGEAEETTRTYRELVNDFRPYIESAAQATGPRGITPLFLASLLFIEVFNRPKEGRESELEGVGNAIASLQRGEMLYPWQKVDRSVGVGQVRLSTAAMVTGATPWVDQDRNDRSQGREQTEQNFEGLSANQKASLFELLRWPKSNIVMAANLLATLKNRENRFPNLTRSAFGRNEQAIGVVASEYNLGPSSSLADEAQASWYGQSVWSSMNSDPILTHYFTNS